MTNKSNMLTKIVFWYSQSVKAGTKRRLDSPLFDIFESTFRVFRQDLDIKKFVSRTLKCTKIINILFQLSTIYETLKSVKDFISNSNNGTYKNLGQYRKQKFNYSESQDSPQVLNQFISSCSIFFVSACAKTK